MVCRLTYEDLIEFPDRYCETVDDVFDAKDGGEDRVMEITVCAECGEVPSLHGSRPSDGTSFIVWFVCLLPYLPPLHPTHTVFRICD